MPTIAPTTPTAITGIAVPNVEILNITISTTMTIVTNTLTIDCQFSLHHSQALSHFSSNQLFSISSFKYSYFS